jgi:hypothetical protein
VGEKAEKISKQPPISVIAVDYRWGGHACANVCEFVEYKMSDWCLFAYLPAPLLQRKQIMGTHRVFLREPGRHTLSGILNLLTPVIIELR